MIITIDGPAGAGKSSIARRVASELGFEFLDTGAMYRAVTWGVMQQGIAWDDVESLVEFADAAQLIWQDDRIYLDNQDISEEIRTPQVTSHIRYLADPPRIRERITAQQRRIATGRDIVTEGRDQGTEVFPDAHCKIFLTASPEERARRRQRQLAENGRVMSVEEILAAQNQRDLEDRMRPVGRLRAASDAIVVQTDGMSPDEVREEVLRLVRECVQASAANSASSDVTR
ncbi:MAG TPA: (d)CMP kinase [Rhodopirellula baltica]|uniref:Cytidylate kinase n=1 Tax=Rhodopirellula baltica (strain DSM 10527 / NCIMB 13988 / SH1) TaxID=243090 RepID=KCY_RHOBA|nr:(d)CMP kinase [Rhodopirellula baltica]Q7UEW6.1 RecName: Full=Cytidylate kinase; Short=CK; AltName: Full=Cytidine monophosphate kinase; Short=CMP kinase [Rhodopirellula baltica SH 1]CAD78918.1 cytidylate kinase [Rhodopirellula baltica SH 1]HBE64474.1 (d)CMP kinase [Rhodopirellula baltica]